MKLVFEMINGEPYMYVATERHFKDVESQIAGKRITPKELENECWLNANRYPTNFHMVFNLKGKQ